MHSEEMAAYIASARSRDRERQQHLDARYAKMQEVATRGAALLKRNFGCDRVWLFGSALARDRIHGHSDVDLAVVQLPGRLYWQALAALLDLDPDISVDLALLEETSESLRQRITNEGIAL